MSDDNDTGKIYKVYHSHIWKPEFLKDCVKIRRWEAPSPDPSIKAVMLYTRKDAEKYCNIVERYGATFYHVKKKGLNGTVCVPIKKPEEKVLEQP